MKTMWIPLDCSALPPQTTPSSGLPVIQDSERCSLPWDAVTDKPFYSIGERRGRGGRGVSECYIILGEEGLQNCYITLYGVGRVPKKLQFLRYIIIWPLKTTMSQFLGRFAAVLCTVDHLVYNALLADVTVQRFALKHILHVF